MQTDIAMISLEEKPTERMKRSIFYRTVRQLNQQYDAIILQLPLSEQDDYGAIVTQLTEYERRIAADAKPIEQNVFSAQHGRTKARPTKNHTEGRGGHKNHGRSPFRRRCHNCDEEGHVKIDCSKLNSGNRGSTGPLATSYGGRGLSPPIQGSYMAEEVSWSAVEVIENVTEKVLKPCTCSSTKVTKGVTKTNVLSAVEVTKDARGPDAIVWVIESGCSRHMTYWRDAFVFDYELLPTPITIRIANGGYIQAITKGTARLRVKVRGKINYVLLKNVLHVPNIAGSLLSVTQLQDNEIMSQTTCIGNWVLKRYGRIIGVATRLGRLYALDSGLEGHQQPMPPSAYRTEVDDSKMWHLRFGHLAPSTLLNVHNVTIGLNAPLCQGNDVCEPRIASKLTRNVSRVEPERGSMF